MTHPIALRHLVHLVRQRLQLLCSLLCAGVRFICSLEQGCLLCMVLPCRMELNVSCS